MSTFLTAEWRNLALLNYQIDPALLEPFLPDGLQIDFYQGNTFVSVVGFQFLHTRVLGVPFPFHRNFEEVNLRFYVRREAPEGWRRGVVFIKEIVPRRAIAIVARCLYGEPYVCHPMRHLIDRNREFLKVEYGWQRKGAWEHLSVTAEGEPMEMKEGSIEEFITEHYWGYTACGAGFREYQVEHPRWRYWPATTSNLQAGVASLYGSVFVQAVATSPCSAFIAEGSNVSVKSYETVRNIRIKDCQAAPTFVA